MRRRNDREKQRGFARCSTPPIGSTAAERMRRVRERARHEPELFARVFCARWCPLPPSPLHTYVFARRKVKTREPLERRRGAIDVVLAPRGSAKSTLVSFVLPLHAALFGIDPYIVLLSATDRQAAMRLADLRAALEAEGPLRAAFADVLTQPPRLTARTIELAGARIDAFGAGTELRGIRHGPWRPTWIVLDDVERSDRVRSSRHRDALYEWFTEVVEHLGSPATHIDLVGTLLHPDALPARLARRPDVVARTFVSILAEATRQDLWDAWRERLHRLEDPDRLDTARRWFEAHRSAMLEGARVLWPEREDYYALQLLREAVGPTAFDKEKQNRPPAEGSAVFRLARLRRFDLVGERVVREPGALGHEADVPPERALADLRRFGFLDPALGGERGDFAAIATVGIDAAGYCHVLDVWLERAPPAVQIEQAFALHAHWRYERFGVETNAFQRLLLEPLEAERTRRRARGEPWDLPLVEHRHRLDKTARILALEPLAANGWLLFNRALPEAFYRQLADFPAGRHDDGPDAVAAAVALARAARAVPAAPLRRPRPSSPSIGSF